MGQSSSKIRVTPTDKAILQLKLAKDNLHRYTKRTYTLITDEREELKKMIKEDNQDVKKNPRARLLLKRIHYQQHLLDQCSDQLINLENLLMTIEFKLVEQQFIERLTQGNEVLKKLNREFEGVGKLMDDVGEQIAYQEEIDNVLSNSLVSVVGGFQEELDRELDELDEEINHKNKITDLPSVNGLPEVKIAQQPHDAAEEPVHDASNSKSENKTSEMVLTA
ncbi:HGR014Wp [Eremothecium sinecaudum]|uniref:HGR014Wp n=1 Tax=Eremothecium sinecaudum TaxID=45286 RepID=A0A120K2R2_9SACH|nr:HGR014Wp [Eremothecium sinecaudum]AMD22353.1 HGR014Wp [Eremothecium sinecaudum]